MSIEGGVPPFLPVYNLSFHVLISWLLVLFFFDNRSDLRVRSDFDSGGFALCWERGWAAGVRQRRGMLVSVLCVLCSVCYAVCVCL